MKNISRFRIVTQLGTLLFLTLVFFTFPNFLKPLFLVSILLFGVFYCGWLCPFGFLQDIGAYIGRKLGIKKRQVPNAIHNVLVYMRYIFALIVLLVVSDTLFTILAYEPMGTTLSLINRHLPNALALSILVFFILISIVYERAYCRYFCHEGAKYGFFSLFRLFTIKRNNHTCVQCNKCDRACPMQINITKVENLRSPQCINCLKCISVCPVKGALTYGLTPPPGQLLPCKKGTDGN